MTKPSSVTRNVPRSSPGDGAGAGVVPLSVEVGFAGFPFLSCADVVQVVVHNSVAARSMKKLIKNILRFMMTVPFIVCFRSIGLCSRIRLRQPLDLVIESVLLGFAAVENFELTWAMLNGLLNKGVRSLIIESDGRRLIEYANGPVSGTEDVIGAHAAHSEGIVGVRSSVNVNIDVIDKLFACTKDAVIPLPNRRDN